MWGMFGLCVAFLGISFACQLRLDALARHPQRYHKASFSDEETSDGGVMKVAAAKVIDS